MRNIYLGKIVPYVQKSGILTIAIYTANGISINILNYSRNQYEESG